MDREKVIKGLECCLGSNDCDIDPEEDCPYKGMCLCAMALRLDVLNLLKKNDLYLYRVTIYKDDGIGRFIFHKFVFAKNKEAASEFAMKACTYDDPMDIIEIRDVSLVSIIEGELFS